MTFIETVPPERAGPGCGLLRRDLETFGRVANFTRAFSLWPEVYSAWRELNGAIKGGMDLRTYELATLAAAQRLRSTYCMLAHGSVLADQFLDAEAVRAVVIDRRTAGLDARDVTLMDLAEKVPGDATAVTQADIDGLRAHGMSDAEILGVVLAASVRQFFSKTLGAQPDRRYAELEPGLRNALTVGRRIAVG